MSLMLAVLLSTAAQTPPEEWSCEAERFADSTCDCGCGAVDDDCASASADDCARDNCPEGQVAWQDNNASCMADDGAGGCAAAPAAPGVIGAVLVAVRRRARRGA